MIADLFDIPIASLFLEQITPAAETKTNVRKIELQTVEKQLQDVVAEHIAKAFEKLQ